MKRSGSGGFTLVELLVVIGILTLLSGLIVAAVGHVREQGRQVVCITQLRQIGQAVTTYEQDWGEFPPPRSWPALISYTGQNWQIWVCPDDPRSVKPSLSSYHYSWHHDLTSGSNNAQQKEKLGYNNFPVFFCDWHTAGIGGTGQFEKTDFLLLFPDGRVERITAPSREGWGGWVTRLMQRYGSRP